MYPFSQCTHKLNQPAFNPCCRIKAGWLLFKRYFFFFFFSVWVCFSLVILCSVFFLLTGSFLGNFLFHSTLAGNFIVTLAWICPFLYTSSALLSAINGLGLTTLTLMINLLGLSIRILSVYFGIPHYGIAGYLWGLFISQSTVCLVALLTLSHEIKKEYLQSVESATD